MSQQEVVTFECHCRDKDLIKVGADVANLLADESYVILHLDRNGRPENVDFGFEADRINFNNPRFITPTYAIYPYKVDAIHERTPE